MLPALTCQCLGDARDTATSASLCNSLCQGLSSSLASLAATCEGLAHSVSDSG
mgnify:CR=1